MQGKVNMNLQLIITIGIKLVRLAITTLVNTKLLSFVCVSTGISFHGVKYVLNQHPISTLPYWFNLRLISRIAFHPQVNYQLLGENKKRIRSAIYWQNCPNCDEFIVVMKQSSNGNDILGELEKISYPQN